MQHVLRESYLETTQDLRFYALKVIFSNQQQRFVREHTTALRQHKEELIEPEQDPSEFPTDPSIDVQYIYDVNDTAMSIFRKIDG